MKALEIIFVCNTVYAALIRKDNTVTTPSLAKNSGPRTAVTPSLDKCSKDCDGPRVFDHNCLGCGANVETTAKQMEHDPDKDVITNCTHYRKICLQLCAKRKQERGTTIYPAQYNSNICEDECLEQWYCPLERYDTIFNNRRVLGPVVVPDL